MSKGNNRHYWHTTIYEEHGKEYTLCGTFNTKKEANLRKKQIEMFPENGIVKIKKEEQYYRVYAPY